MTGALTIKTVHDGRICALTVSGALDLTTAAEFLEHVARAVDDRTERFVLDLAGLAFLDCAGARALVMAAYAAPSGCPVIVRSVGPPAARLIDLLDLDLQHLWQDPSAGLEYYGRAGAAGATSPVHSAERPHTLNRAR
jgi:anti-anti-sigma factor